jgi:NADPH-dependent curcumin reductase CurA
VPEDFEIVSETLPPLAPGEMLLKTKYLTLDPYMRSEYMNSKRAVGPPVIGGTVSEVIESRCEGWSVGDLVVGYYGWTEYKIATAEDVQWNLENMPIEKWDTDLGEPSTALGVLGMTGYTAYHGLVNICSPQAGETVVVSAASGAVGQVVGQLAKIAGCHVVGVAGGPAKCSYCTDELGFDACVDYKAEGFGADTIKEVCPNGIDIYFENVGGDVLEAVIPNLNANCRVPICGYIARYNVDNFIKVPEGNPMIRLKELGLPILGRKGSTSGFTFFGWNAMGPEERSDVLQELSRLLQSGEQSPRGNALFPPSFSMEQDQLAACTTIKAAGTGQTRGNSKLMKKRRFW